ncbi:MAM and LDL-receptor class A domain-containing protein 2 [Ciona intestinalis]
MGLHITGWGQKPFDNFDWTVRNPSVVQRVPIDPVPSHSIRYGGPFAHVNASTIPGVRYHRRTTLVTSWVVLKANKEYCLDFWFFQLSNRYRGEKLNLYTVNHANTQRLFGSFVSFQHTWQNGLAQVKGQGSKIKFEFEAVRGIEAWKTNVGLDNITLQEGPCPPPFGFNCSFDLPNPLCPGWTTSLLDPINPGFNNSTNTINPRLTETSEHTGNGGMHANVFSTYSAVLLSPEIVLNDHRVYCLDFWYYLNAEIKMSLDIIQFSNTFLNQNVLGWFSENSTSWKRGLVEIEKSSIKTQIGFRAVKLQSSRVELSIGVDDITIYPGRCLAGVIPSSFNCTFERNKDLCPGWSQSLDDSANWGYKNGRISIKIDYPRNSFERYANLNIGSNKTATLVSPIIYLNSSSQYCLSFLHEVSGGKLNLYHMVGETTKLVRTFPTTWRWLSYMQLFNSSQLPNKFIFESVGLPNRIHRASLDDIIMYPGACPSFNCSFDETPICLGWSQSQIGSRWNIYKTTPLVYTRLRHSAPYRDHSGNGLYAYAHNDRPERAGLVSKQLELKANKNYCLDFWFFNIRKWSNLGYIEVVAKHGSRSNVLQTFTESHSDWQHAQVAITGQPTQIELWVREGPASIDDITMYQGSCPTSVFNCTFDKSPTLCHGWLESTFSRWSYTDGANTTQIGAPTTDHSGGKYALAGENVAGFVPLLVSPGIVLNESDSYCLDFWFYISGTARLDVVYLEGELINHKDQVLTWFNTPATNWQHGKVEIKRTTYPIKVGFQATRNNQSIIAVDDIKMRPTSCQNPTLHVPADQFSCKFDITSSFCKGWSQESGNKMLLFAQGVLPNTRIVDLVKHEHTGNGKHSFYHYIEHCPVPWQSGGRYAYVGLGRAMLMYQNNSVQLVSPIVTLNTTAWYCLTAAYLNNGGWRREGYEVNIYQVKNNVTSVILRSTTKRSWWQQFGRTIRGSNKPVQFILEIVFPGTIGFSALFLDDIVLYPTSCLDLPFNCSFDHPQLCLGWSQSWSDQLTWRFRNKWTSSRNTGPEYEHTENKGYYAFVEADTGTVGNRGVMFSPRIHQKSNVTYCFDFWYHKRGEFGAGSLLNVFKTSSKRSTQRNLIKSFSEVHTHWRHALIKMNGQREPFRVGFEVILGNDNSDIAIDDVTMYEGNCPTPKFNCTFDDDVPLCEGWTMEDPEMGPAHDRYNFTSKRTWSTVTGTVQLTDHRGQGGKFAYVQLPVYYLTATSALLVTPNISIEENTSRCLDFWYYIRGRRLRRLEVYLYNHPTSLQSNNVLTWFTQRTTEWVNAKVNVRGSAQPIRIGFHGERSRDSYAFFDDVVLLPTPCPETPAIPVEPSEFSCSFDKTEDFCHGWKQSMSDDVDWLFINRINITETHVVVERQRNGGMFAYVPTSRFTNGTRAVLHSPIVMLNTSEEYCFSFYALMTHFSPGQFLNVYMHDGQSKQLIHSLNTPIFWDGVHIPIRPYSPNAEFSFEAITGVRSASNISIDDITIHSGSCVGRNFNCSFNWGLCGGWSASSAHLNWFFSPSADRRPFQEHTGNSGYFAGVLAVAGRPLGSTAVLTSPPITLTAEQVYCVDYWVRTTPVDSRARARVRVNSKLPGNTSLLSRCQVQTHNWKNCGASITPNVTDVYQIEIDVIFETTPEFTFIFDDITIYPGRCRLYRS